MKRTTALLTGLIAGLATSAATAPAAPIATSAGLPTLTLAMNGKSIHVSGSMKAGAVIVVAKTSREEQSSPPLVKLARKVSFAQAFRQVAAHGGDTNYLDGHATITYNTANSAGTGRAQTVLTPGRWVALDSVNNNPATWPRASFTVSRSGHPASLPKPAATVKMIEFGFTGPSTWHEGELIRFQNAGFLAHMAVAAQAKDEQDAQTLSALLLAGQDNQAQKLATGFATFVGTASAGAVQQQRVTAAPGIYVLACFMDTQDHREHTRLAWSGSSASFPSRPTGAVAAQAETVAGITDARAA